MASPASSTPASPQSPRSPLASSRSPSFGRHEPLNLANPTTPNAPWLVQKFGGTSVGKFPVKIAREVVATYLRPATHRLALVCSARSGSTKATGTTSLLLKAADEALVRATSTKEKSRRGSSGAATPHHAHSNSQSSAHGASTPLAYHRGIVPRRSYSHLGSVGSPPQSEGGISPQHTGTDNGHGARPAVRGLGGAFSFTPMNGGEEKARDLPAFHKTVDQILSDHIACARQHIADPHIRADVEEDIREDVEWVRGFLGAASIIDEISPRSRDAIVGLGERLACKMMVGVLRDQGIEAEYVSLEDVVPAVGSWSDLEDVPGSSKILSQPFYDALATAIGERVLAVAEDLDEELNKRIDEVAARGAVPVVTGFFGPVPGSLLAQIGRGYTDLCSALLAVGLGAEELQIWKEVDGIFTADPRKVPTARLIPVISPDEAAELTYYGSEVVHPFVMEQAIRRKIPIRIKNVDNPQGGGTVIHPDPEAETVHPGCPDSEKSGEGAKDPSPVPEPATPGALAQYTAVHTNGAVNGKTNGVVNGNGLSRSSRTNSVSSLAMGKSGSCVTGLFAAPDYEDPAAQKLPTAVTIKENILVINVHSNRKSVSHGFLAGIFGVLDRFGVVVDLISTSEVHVSMAISDGIPKRTLDRLLSELRRSGAVSHRHDMAILSLVGKQMRNMIGISGKMFSTLADGRVNIEMISQGASEINISCVIEAADAVKALNIIHQGCLMIRPQEPKGRVGPWLF